MNVKKADTFNADVYHYFNDSRITSLAGGYSDPLYMKLYTVCADHKLTPYVPLLYLGYTHCIFRYDGIGARFLKVQLNDEYLHRIENEFYVQKIGPDHNEYFRVKRTDGRQIESKGFYIGCSQADGSIIPYHFRLTHNTTEEFRRLLFTFLGESDPDNELKTSVQNEVKRSIIGQTSRIEQVFDHAFEDDRFQIATADAEHYLPYKSKNNKTEDIDE